MSTGSPCCVGLTLKRGRGFSGNLLQSAIQAARWVKANSQVPRTPQKESIKLLELDPNTYQIVLCATDILKPESILNPQLMRNKRKAPLRDVFVELGKRGLDITPIWLCPLSAPM